jgi:hypothetical protein
MQSSPYRQPTAANAWFGAACGKFAGIGADECSSEAEKSVPMRIRERDMAKLSMIHL